MALLNDASSARLLESSATRVDGWWGVGMYGQIRCVFIFSYPIQRLSAENSSLFSRYEAAAASLVSRSGNACGMAALARIFIFCFFCFVFVFILEYFPTYGSPHALWMFLNLSLISRGDGACATVT